MKRSCILFIFLSAFSGLVAQPSNKDGEESENQYNFCVLYLDYNQDQASKATSSQIRWHYVSNESPYKLSVTSGGVSRDYTYKGASNLAFYNELIKINEEKVYQPLLQVALGKPGRKLIVIFGDGSGNYRGIAQEIGESVLPIDTLRVLNLSKQSVAAMVGEERSQVGPMKSVNFSVSGSTVDFAYIRILVTSHGFNQKTSINKTTLLGFFFTIAMFKAVGFCFGLRWCVDFEGQLGP